MKIIKLIVFIIILVLNKSLFSQNNDELVVKANQLIAVEKYWEAIKVYDEIIKNDPFNAKNFNSRAVVKERAGDTKGAIADYSFAIMYDKNFALAYHNRGSLYLSIGENEKACSDFETALSLGYPRSRRFFEQNCKK